jgi:glutamine amidotransferase
VCRHLAYLGAPVPLSAVLADPPHGLIRQSWAPRTQQHGTVNADGFGVGWYADGDPVPARHRGGGPIWADPTLTDLVRVVRSHAVVAAVRSATPGTAHGAAAAAPFADGRWLFSHNGVVPDWPESVADLAAALPPAELVRLDAASDSALLWALIRHRLRQGESAPSALVRVVTAVAARVPSRLTVVMLDGQQIVGCVLGEPMVVRALDGGISVASEPWDDDPAWRRLPDAIALTATPGGLATTPL